MPKPKALLVPGAVEAVEEEEEAPLPSPPLDEGDAALSVAAAFDAADGALDDGEAGLDFDDDDLALTEADAVALGFELADEAADEAPASIPSSSTGDAAADAALAAFDVAVDDWLAEADAGAPPVPVLAAVEPDDPDASSAPLCARCYSLVHYGRVKSKAAEAALPDLDVGAVVGRKLALTKFRRRVVLAVVDVADFDGSLPRADLSTLLAAAGGARGDERARERGAPPSSSPSSQPPPSFILAVNKADLLPSAATPARVEAWARRRCRAAGLPRPDAVHLVSAATGTGVPALLATVHAALGDRGDAWVVGTQNAGKSSLLTAFRRAVGKRGAAATAAPLAGTTLAVLRVRGLTPPGSRMLDTPGVRAPHSVGAALPPEVATSLAPRRTLVPRTFRAGPGQTVLLGGAARIDILECPGATLYLTAWVSPEVGCHFGRTDGADARRRGALGAALAPPAGEAAALDAALGELVPADVTVSGDTWRASSVDVAVAGFGWAAIALSGTATLRVWAPPGVAVTVRDALLPDLARDLCRPGFVGGGKQHGGGGVGGRGRARGGRASGRGGGRGRP